MKTAPYDGIVMRRRRGGSRFTITLVGTALGTLVVLGSLVVSGQLPQRGLVSGDVRAGIVGPLSGQPVIFERIDGADVLSVRTDAHGHFSATLPPGYYYVDQAIPICPRIGAATANSSRSELSRSPSRPGSMLRSNWQHAMASGNVTVTSQRRRQPSLPALVKR